MKIETQILNSYWGLLSTLNPSLKLKLIEKLSKSISKDMSSKDDRLAKSFGAWVDSRDSDEIINEIKESRTFNRQIESF
ncbi:MAG: hypothetical protein JXR50_03730 [Prolixibacteraceae bacterium]|jgi:hypothetical protein|nr:hypothetical protein [Prolixibacteraceae bacterium]MBN2648833.1 hypothetical protein [Prolixibacteraceae bacterium]